MTRRETGMTHLKRFFANVNTKEVHDLDNEDRRCHIDRIIHAGNDRGFDSIAAARAAGFDNGHWCLGDSKR